MDLDVADTGFPTSRGELSIEVPRLIWSAKRGGEYESVVLPGVINTEAVRGLTLGAEPEGSCTDIRQRQYRSRSRRLGLPVTKLMASSLELPPHMDFSGLEVDIPPGEPERFATAQAKHEDEDVGGVQRIVIATGRFQERTSLFDRPPLALPFPGSGKPDDSGDIAGKELLRHGVSQRGPERVTHILYGPLGEHLVAAGAGSAAAPAANGTTCILTLGAALAGGAQPIEPSADITNLETVEPLHAKAGNEVQASKQRIFLSGLRRKVGLDDFPEPISQVWDIHLTGAAEVSGA
jgi:hypothetical protein